MIGPEEMTLRDAMQAAQEAMDALQDSIIPALVLAMGEEGAADVLRDFANELDGD